MSSRASKYERVDRSKLKTRLEDERAGLEESLDVIQGTINTGVDKEIIRKFRTHLFELQILVEEEIVPNVERVEPYETATQHLPYELLADGLDLRWKDVQDLPRKSELENE